MPDPLSALLFLSDQEKNARGLIHTPREIHQQPETWTGTFRRLQSLEASLLGVLAECGIHSTSQNRPDVILAGAGTSDYIGRCLQGLLQTHWRCNVRSIPSTDLLIGLAESVLPGRPCVLISFSRSGDSSEGVAVLSLALQRFPQQIRHIVITCNQAGAMAHMPGVFPIVLDDAVNDRGLAMTSSFTNMIIAGQLLAFLGASRPFEPILHGLTAMGQSMLARAEIASTLARNGYRRVCFLGSGALRGVAHECALKVLELNAGRIATLAETFLGLRHGPMSFLDAETLVCAFLSGEPGRRRYEIDLLREIQTKRLARDMLVLSPSPDDEVRQLTPHLLELNAPADFPDDCRPPVDVIAGQLLALFLSIENGIQPDTPSSGAISRVVSHVKIYPPKTE